MLYKILTGDCLNRLRKIPSGVINTCVTSPPYFGLRDYGVDGQIGLEATPEEFVAKMVEVFREVRRVLRDDGTLWLNLGDSYAGAGYSNHKNTGGAQVDQGGKQRHLSGTGLKNKDLIGIPWRVAFALQADGWYLRQDIIWHKPNPMPESVRDRCTKAHEYIFLLSKSMRYYFDNGAIKEPATSNSIGAAASFKRVGSKREQTIPGQGYGTHRPEREYVAYNETRNRRSVWTVATKPFSGAHFATFPPALIEPCILAGAPSEGIVLDPFNGAGTTGLVALRNQRNYIGCELNPEYVAMSEQRILSEMSLNSNKINSEILSN